MSKYLTGFIVLLLLGSSQVFSQNNDLFLRRNKFAINIFSLIRRPVVVDQEAYYPVVFHGIVYTRDLGNGNFVRARFDYFQRNRDRSTETNMDVNLYSDIQMGGGWFYSFGDRMVVPYLGSDLVMTSLLRFSEKGGVDAGTYRKIQSRSLGLSLMPLAGITLQVTSVLSFSLETNVELGYAHEKGTDFTWGEDRVPVEKKIQQSIFLARWNPVSLLSIELSF
jgi:hypothetical protein